MYGTTEFLNTVRWQQNFRPKTSAATTNQLSQISSEHKALKFLTGIRLQDSIVKGKAVDRTISS